MLFEREIFNELEKWKTKVNRKPLVIRGARQVGKTTVINQFAKKFKQYIYLNLELTIDRKPFEEFTTLELLIQRLFFIKNQLLSHKNDTLLFIDEIQEVPEALNILRYFFEEQSDITVIAAGSMLETLFDNNVSFPVGRVEYMVLRPVSFPEFLNAMKEDEALKYLKQVPSPDFTHDKLIQLFHIYSLIGGMPEVIKVYSQTKDLIELSPIFDSLITAYIEDVEKYAGTNVQATHISHAIRSSFVQAGQRIKFEGFGNSSYKSRDMGDALRILEKALLIELIYPSSEPKLPLLPDHRKSPRLQVLDTGMLNYFAGIQSDILGSTDLNRVYQGKMIEHLVGQELLAMQFRALSALHFWVREKNTSSAEVDYIIPFEGQLIPVEVKSGAQGKLKSLNIFMDLAPHNIAVRFYAGLIQVTDAVTQNGKKYKLLNLPYYMVSQIEPYLRWFKTLVQVTNES